MVDADRLQQLGADLRLQRDVGRQDLKRDPERHAERDRERRAAQAPA